MSSADEEQCKALTESGERCSRPIQEDEFCHQHGPEDETIETDESAEKASETDQDSDSTDNEETMSQESESATEITEVREKVKDIAEGVVGHPLDGITSVDRDDDLWRVSIEVVERKGVPDTQDILGRYELMLDENLSVNSYERTHRFRRDDMEHNV